MKGTRRIQIKTCEEAADDEELGEKNCANADAADGDDTDVEFSFMASKSKCSLLLVAPMLAGWKMCCGDVVADLISYTTVTQCVPRPFEFSLLVI